LQVEEDIEMFRNKLAKYKARLKKVKEEVNTQECEGHEYVLRHIKKVGKRSIFIHLRTLMILKFCFTF